MEAWGMFEMREKVRLIDKDLTGAICFMWGVTGGSMCALLGGSWALAVDLSYATAVAIYAFLISYLMARIEMAWLQACVCVLGSICRGPQAIPGSTQPYRIGCKSCKDHKFE
ncbi:hypothetical protein Scep_014415 [Stephania cephalantha]|uniref:Uncharacterized protein n=1 Tax=Stephania cephalantha TaxID=152367 RepID=A0AAP0J172_9MAGN